ncbi:MAG: nuclear transport factor 2 family protein [Actinobacteria bacterium]|nr:MAG: nuclear transport factor 2 family protein [Actinomycetota bacterium]
MLWMYGPDGLLTRYEQFDADCDHEALARFEELTAGPADVRFAAAPPRVAKKLERRVRSNAATANVARLEAAIAARDADALSTLIAERAEVMEHTTGATYDRRGLLTTWRSLLRGRDLTFRQEPLATLGDSLALSRSSLSASGVTGGKLDVGPYESASIDLIEVDAQGRWLWAEIFAADRLGDAVVRLYERYAELLPDGPEHVRAAATARSVAALPLVGAHDLDRLDRSAWVFAPAIEYVDHRTVGMGSVHGAEAVERAVRALLELMEDSATRLDELLALRSDAFLARWTHFGTDRASGGAFERRLCHLWVFGVDGLMTRGEQFDAEREDEALARFDELTAEPAAARFATAPSRAVERRVRANAATANAARVGAAIAARDADTLPTLFADEYENVDHTTGVTYDRQGEISSLRALLSAQDATLLHEPLATLGDSLALCRVSTSASGFAGSRSTRRAVADSLSCSQPIASATPSPGCTSATPRCCPTAPHAPAPRRRRGRSRRCWERRTTPIATPRCSRPPSKASTTALWAPSPRMERILCCWAFAPGPISSPTSSCVRTKSSACSPMRSCCGGPFSVSTAPAAVPSRDRSSGSWSSGVMVSWRATSSSTPIDLPTRSPASTS